MRASCVLRASRDECLSERADVCQRLHVRHIGARESRVDVLQYLRERRSGRCAQRGRDSPTEKQVMDERYATEGAPAHLGIRGDGQRPREHRAGRIRMRRLTRGAIATARYEADEAHDERRCHRSGCQRLRCAGEGGATQVTPFIRTRSQPAAAPPPERARTSISAAPCLDISQATPLRGVAATASDHRHHGRHRRKRFGRRSLPPP